MRKITVALEDAVYVKLIDHAAEKSKRNGSRLSISESASELIARALVFPSQREENEAC